MCTHLPASLVVDFAFLEIVEFGQVVVDVLFLEGKKLWSSKNSSKTWQN